MITIGAQGTRQGVYTPQVRVYHKIGTRELCEVFNLRFLGSVRDRKEAVRRGKEWLKRDGATQAAETARALLYAGSRTGINTAALCHHVLKAVPA